MVCRGGAGRGRIAQRKGRKDPCRRSATSINEIKKKCKRPASKKANHNDQLPKGPPFFFEILRLSTSFSRRLTTKTCPMPYSRFQPFFKVSTQISPVFEMLGWKILVSMVPACAPGRGRQTWQSSIDAATRVVCNNSQRPSKVDHKEENKRKSVSSNRDPVARQRRIRPRFLLGELVFFLPSSRWKNSHFGGE